jgi:hypothetical protein
VGLIVAATLVLSLLAAVLGRRGVPLFALAALAPADVWRGQIWRLVTWPVFEPSPFGLIVGCVMITWLGRDLAPTWGPSRFLRVFGGVLLATGVGTCLLARIDGDVLEHAYAGTWPLTTALIIAWGLTFPDQMVRFYLMLPVRGYWLAWLTVLGTVVFAAYVGWAPLLTNLLAEAAILGWLSRKRLAARWAKARGSLADRERERAVRRRKAARRRGGAVVEYLRPVDDPPDEPGPN